MRTFLSAYSSVWSFALWATESIIETDNAQNHPPWAENVYIICPLDSENFELAPHPRARNVLNEAQNVAPADDIEIAIAIEQARRILESRQQQLQNRGCIFCITLAKCFVLGVFIATIVISALEVSRTSPPSYSPSAAPSHFPKTHTP